MIRKILLYIGLVFIGIVTVKFVGIMILIHRMDEQRKPFETYYALIYVARGCEDYKAANGRWPTSIPESFVSRYGISKMNNNDKDGWGNDFVFVPYDKATGYGEIISFGRDGKPGGSGLDSDWVIRFPIWANYEWDKEQAIEAGIFRGWSRRYDWFDGRLSDADLLRTNDLSTNSVSRKQ